MAEIWIFVILRLILGTTESILSKVNGHITFKNSQRIDKKHKNCLRRTNQVEETHARLGILRLISFKVIF